MRHTFNGDRGEGLRNPLISFMEETAKIGLQIMSHAIA